MLQDIDFKYDDTFSICEPQENDHLIIIKDNMILFGRDNSLPSFGKEFTGHKYIYLFKIGEDRFFYLNEDFDEFGDYHYVSFNQRLRVLPKWLDFAVITGRQFGNWYRNNRYCGKCGHLNSFSDKERMLYCENCKTTIYPRISPAVIVAVVNKENDSIIVTRRRPESKGLALISGFTEVGETVEDTCRREVMEEVGVRIKNIRYYKSQPWSFSDSLLLGFVADLDGDDKLTVDYSENADAFWIKRSDLDIRNEDYALTREMLDEFAKGNLN
ncbi:MAG: NAD(+) diphosphatase [Erysipelotrichaceae bacterium]|nr:NAD(+) diphosphatase [Erysipelotrichaceae bacterium]